MQVTTDSPIATSFIPAVNFSAVPLGRKIDLIVLHSMQSQEKPGTARRVANWFGGLAAPMASAHYCVDDIEIIQCVNEADIAWAAPGANHNGIHIELAGMAEQTTKQWNDEYSLAVIRKLVLLCAELCWRNEIPRTYVRSSGLTLGHRGITTHADVSKAFKKSSHWDPGPSFPIYWVVRKIRELILEKERLKQMEEHA